MRRTLSKAVEQARGCVAVKIGRGAIVVFFRNNQKGGIKLFRK